MIPTFVDSFARFSRPSFAGGTPRPAGAPRALGQTWDGYMGLPAWMGDAVRFMVHGSTGAIGIYLGITGTSSLWSTAGWIVGIMSAFAALLDVCSIIGRITGPEEE
jgi:hypothetical protein